MANRCPSNLNFLGFLILSSQCGVLFVLSAFEHFGLVTALGTLLVAPAIMVFWLIGAITALSLTLVIGYRLLDTWTSGLAERFSTIK